MSKSVDVVKGIYEAFGRGDVGAVLGAFEATIEWREADNFLYAEGNPYIGPQAVAQGVFQRIVTDAEGFNLAVENVIDGGDAIVAQGRYRGTMRKTGTPVDAQFAHVWHVRDGKVVRFQQYTDTRQWAQAAGI